MAGLVRDVEPLLLDVLRPALAPVQVGSENPARLLGILPYVVARSVPGGRVIGPHRDTVTDRPVQVDAYAATRHAAQLLCSQALGALVAAWRAHTVTAHGAITTIGAVSPPSEIHEPGQPDALRRYVATLNLTLRP
jgi:hypothetical protein